MTRPAANSRIASELGPSRCAQQVEAVNLVEDVELCHIRIVAQPKVGRMLIRPRDQFLKALLLW